MMLSMLNPADLAGDGDDPVGGDVMVAMPMLGRVVHALGTAGKLARLRLIGPRVVRAISAAVSRGTGVGRVDRYW